jgi:hypothetical protein
MTGSYVGTLEPEGTAAPKVKFGLGATRFRLAG